MTPHKQKTQTPIMSDTSDNISDKSLRERVHFEVPVLADQLYRSPDRQALRDDITTRYENTLRSLDDGKRAAALSDLAALDGESL